MAEESGGGDVHAGPIRAGFTEHFDSAIVMLLLIALFTAAVFAAGRYIGNRLGAPGVTGFFGG